MTVLAGYQTMPKCFDDRGFQVMCGVTSAPAVAAATTLATAKLASQVNAGMTASSTTDAAHQNSAARFELTMPLWCVGVMTLVLALLR